MVELGKPFQLHLTAMLYIYKVFEHLHILMMSIWGYTHTVTTTDISPEL
jgi:hypothetical protein